MSTDLGVFINFIVVLILFYLVSGEPLLDQSPDEFFEMSRSLVRRIRAALAQLFQDALNRVPAIEALPNEDTRRIKAEGVAGIRVEKNSPVIELLSQDQQRIGQWPLFIEHGLTSVSINIG